MPPSQPQRRRRQLRPPAGLQDKATTLTTAQRHINHSNSSSSSSNKICRTSAHPRANTKVKHVTSRLLLSCGSSRGFKIILFIDDRVWRGRRRRGRQRRGRRRRRGLRICRPPVMRVHLCISTNRCSSTAQPKLLTQTSTRHEVTRS
nr:uncharacterized protein LOC123763302 [Procambarus clarkii]